MPFSCQKVAGIIFAADGSPFPFIVLGDIVWRHFVYCRLHSGSKWWSQVSYSVTICERKPSRPVQCKKLMRIALLAFVLQLTTFLSPNELTSWNNQVLQQSSVRCLCPWLEFSIIYLSSSLCRHLKVASYQFSHSVLSFVNCSARATILRFVMKFCS